jgi:hypothetical protein
MASGWHLMLTEGLLPVYCHAMLPSEEVTDTKRINIKQYLSTNNSQ